MKPVIKIDTLGAPINTIQFIKHKNSGHPDQICKGLLNHLVHKNPQVAFDRVVLTPGKTRVRFGGGDIYMPIRISVDCAINLRSALRKINWEYRLREQCYSYLCVNYLFLHEKNTEIVINSVYQNEQELWLTGNSVIVREPRQLAEQILTDLDKLLKTKEVHTQFPEIGDDVTIIWIKESETPTLILQIAFIDFHIKNLKMYLHKKAQIMSFVKEYLFQKYNQIFKVHINPKDNLTKGELGCFLTVLGTTAECLNSGFASVKELRQDFCLAQAQQIAIEVYKQVKRTVQVGIYDNLINIQLENLKGINPKEIEKTIVSEFAVARR